VLSFHDVATPLSPTCSRTVLSSSFAQLMVVTWSVALRCQIPLDQSLSSSCQSGPNVEAGSSADRSLAPFTWTGLLAACAAGAIRKAEVAMAMEAMTLVRKDIFVVPCFCGARPGPLTDPAAWLEHRIEGHIRVAMHVAKLRHGKLLRI
jgi:hypothetical protein